LKNKKIKNIPDISGVESSISSASISAPCANNISTTAVCPSVAA
jgi:hypothetical protein